MSKSNNLHDFLEDVADSIRTKKSYPSTQKIDPQDFSDEIESIQTGITPVGKRTVTANGTYDVTSYAECEVAIPEWDGTLIDAYSITLNLTHVTASQGSPTSIFPDETTSISFSADTNYTLPSSVTVTGASYTWNDATGSLTLSNATGNVSITIVAEAAVIKYAISLTGGYGTMGSGRSWVCFKFDSPPSNNDDYDWELQSMEYDYAHFFNKDESEGEWWNLYSSEHEYTTTVQASKLYVYKYDNYYGTQLAWDYGGFTVNGVDYSSTEIGDYTQPLEIEFTQDTNIRAIIELYD